MITSKLVDQAPQYSVQVRDWKTGGEVAADAFTFKNSSNAKKVDAKDIADTDELPQQFTPGAAQ